MKNNVIFLRDEDLEILDTLCQIVIDNKINEKSIIPFIHGIEYIYSSILIEPTAERIKLDISDGTLTVNIINYDESGLVYLKENGDYFVYNITNDSPDGGEEFEKSMGWI